jgi:hypothetical protein
MIIGVPCVGKSLLMKELMRLDLWVYSGTTKYIPQHWNREHQACILGRYDDLTHKYPGTDRMSMACQPHVIQFIQQNPLVNFLFEGDRLGNASLVDALRRMPNVDLEIIYLHLDSETLGKRRAEQRADQNPKFWASRQTKISNLTSHAMKHKVRI